MSTHSRIPNPALSYPAARQALLRLRTAAADAGLPTTTRLLVEVRASQLNGCSVCLDMHTRELRAAGETDRRIDTVAAWRDVPYFTDAERSALAFAEAATTLAGHSDGVPDAVWAEVVRHHTEGQLAALVLAVAAINAWNRIMVTTGQSGGDWLEDVIAEDHATR